MLECEKVWISFDLSAIAHDINYASKKVMIDIPSPNLDETGHLVMSVVSSGVEHLFSSTTEWIWKLLDTTLTLTLLLFKSILLLGRSKIIFGKAHKGSERNQKKLTFNDVYLYVLDVIHFCWRSLIISGMHILSDAM